jgi:hypothetical protein
MMTSTAAQGLKRGNEGAKGQAKAEGFLCLKLLLSAPKPISSYDAHQEKCFEKIGLYMHGNFIDGVIS